MNTHLRKILAIFVYATLTINLSPSATAQQSRGAANVKVKNEQTGKSDEIRLYAGSYALVVGVSDYTNGWQDLPGVTQDVKAVSDELVRQGFAVTTVLNPNRAKLRSEIESFIESYGYEAGNRLLVYYAGHGDTGKTADGRDLGYIVPSNAPLRTKDENGFRRTAISMDEIEGYARRIEAKHALFVFDSCFSGSLLKARRGNVPPAITYKTTQPVRQFITAGTDEQEVPDKSVFREQFILGLQGDADRNSDSYITGSELADFLQTSVTNYTRGSQTPQYGKIFDGRLDKGDFVFVLFKKNAPATNNTDLAKPDMPVMARSRPEIEREGWSYIKDSRDPQDFRDFLKEFPDGANASNAKIRLEQTLWDSVKDSRDKAKIQAYLNEFPQGANSFLAKTKLRQLEAPAVETNLSNETNSKANEVDNEFTTVRGENNPLKVLADATANGWTNSKILVTKGDSIRISATGRVSLGGGRFSTPAGDSSIFDVQRLIPNEPTGALIAVIGDDNNAFIFIGSKRDFTAPHSGMLFLGINEGNLDDNSGAYDVIIQVKKIRR